VLTKDILFGMNIVTLAGFVVMGLTLTLNRMGQARTPLSVGLMVVGTALVFLGCTQALGRGRLRTTRGRCRILQPLYDSEINASISWLWDGGIDVALGDELTGYDAEGQVSTFTEATAWLRDQACRHYPDSGFARKYCGFV
jgi:hypothetical protein